MAETPDTPRASVFASGQVTVAQMVCAGIGLNLIASVLGNLLP